MVSTVEDHEVERLQASLNQTSFATRDEQEVAGYVTLTRMLQAGLLVWHGSGRAVHCTKR